MLGLDQLAAQTTGLYLFVASVLTHANIVTPRWIGYVVPRPEAHAVHHQRGIHWYNFASLPLWDILAGTFRNPATWDEMPGLVDDATSHLGAMILGQRVESGVAPGHFHSLNWVDRRLCDMPTHAAWSELLSRWPHPCPVKLLSRRLGRKKAHRRGRPC